MQTDINQIFDKVPTMKLLTHNVEELVESGMVIMIPLYLLKLKKEIEAAKKSGNLRKKAVAVITLLEEGILKTLFESEEAGNMTVNDVYVLIGLIDVLYDLLHDEAEEFQEDSVKNILMEKEVESIAKSLLAKGLSPEDVADVTRLSIERVRGFQVQKIGS